jgi:hypothetical protein
MSFELIHLRKIIMLCYCPENRQVSEARADIRSELARERGEAGGGGDFHTPFWRDARDHTLGVQDILASTRVRIAANPARARLYPLLAQGFLRWWDKRRRWTNEPFQRIDSPHARHVFENLGTYKVEGILALRDANADDHFVYPYFSERPELSPESARVMLSCLANALPNIDRESLVVLDVLRGQSYTIDRYPLRGNEPEILMHRWTNILQLRDRLLTDYQ